VLNLSVCLAPYSVGQTDIDQDPAGFTRIPQDWSGFTRIL